MRGLIDAVGSQAAIDAVKPHTYNAGHTFVLNMKNLYKINGLDLETVQLITELSDQVLHLSPNVEVEKDKIIKTTSKCPWAAADSVELCLAGHIAFQMAICEEINPECSVTFTQVMTKGDPICCWVYQNKKAEDKWAKR